MSSVRIIDLMRSKAIPSQREHFADRLVAGVRAKRNAVCVGLDPRWESLPRQLRARYADGTLEGVARAYEEFCFRVLDIVAPLVAITKPQSAFFEICGPAGMVALQRVLRRAREHGLLTILDGKRNDIASTAAAYADAAFAGFEIDGRRIPVWDADAVTVNAYLGREAVEPFLESARRVGGGIFILVRTSNPGAGQFQDLRCANQPLFMHVAQAVSQWSRENLGNAGFGDVGAVVGATHPEELAEVRAALPESIFLVPGFGAQGGSAADTAPAFRADGLGAIVNNSRGINFPFKPDDADWESQIEAATRQMIADLAGATAMGQLAQDNQTSRREK
jgi:orotidine-5'-phosphate decarboxylase